MITRLRTCFALSVSALLLSALAAPGTAAAAPYVSSVPMTVATEGFESASTTWSTSTPLVVLPADGTLFGSWGRVTYRHASGSYALWCGGTMPVSWPKYQAFSAGVSSFDLSQTADLYAAQFGFAYTMPSLGQADGDAFNALWYASGDTSVKVPHTNLPLTAPGSFSRVSYDLTPTVNLSRRAGRFDFQWVDKLENFAQTIATGEGPSVDDVALTGWRYGPVRAVTVSSASNSVTLRWKRPYRAVGSTVLEERGIAYRVWRAPFGTETWSELTGARVADNGVDAVFTDATVVAGTTYRYIIQAWEPGVGDRYGMPTETLGSVAAPPVSWVSSPASGATLSGSSVSVVGGASAQPGSSVTAMSLVIRRDDGMFWNGLSWQPAETAVAVSGANGFASWAYTWILPIGDNRQHTYQLTPRATDSNANTADGPSRVVTVDTRGPRLVRVRSLSATRIELTFSEPVLASSVGPRDFAVTGVRVAFVSVSADGRRATVLTSRRNLLNRTFVTAAQGAFTDRYGNPSYAVSAIVR